MSSLSSSVRLLFAGLIVLAVPMRAQLNPNSAWQKSKTDFLNLYQGTSNTSIKPEILMVLDDTGSTSRLMFHPLFPNNWQDEAPPNSPAAANSGDYSVVVQFSSFPTANGPASGIKVGFTGSPNGSSTTTSSVKASGITYTIGGTRAEVTVHGVVYPTNTLIKPDGNEVLYQDVPSGSKTDPQAWFQCASHMRVRCTVGTHTRDIDFPLSWGMLDSSATLSGSGNTGPLSTAVANDPVHNVNYTMDTTVPGVHDYITQKMVYMDGGFYTSTGFVRSRYIEWIFWGKDPNSPGGASYCIPNAIDSSDATVLNAIDPTQYVFDGLNSVWTVKSGGYISSFRQSFLNNLKGRTRGQAIKECFIKTWLNHQTNVLLAYRFLKDTGQTPASAISTPAPNPGFGSTNWTYMDPSLISTQVPAFAGITWSTGGTTPLTASALSAYSQMTNPAAFKDQINANGYTAAKLECQHHFVFFMTDGAPSETNSPQEASSVNSPYCTTVSPASCPAYSGNAVIKNDAAHLSSTYWNMPTLAGVAAHGGDGSASTPTWIRDPLQEGLSGSYTSLATNAGWVPFWVKQRTTGGTTVQTLVKAQYIQTMTVGVSLGVNFYQEMTGTIAFPGNVAPDLNTRAIPIQIDTTGSKYRLLASAYYGDPATTSYDISTAGPFYLPEGSTTKPADAAYFFDGRDPQTLVSNLDEAFRQIEGMSGNNATAAPVFPTIGGGLGAEVYIARFLPPQTSGPLWTGDLLMFPTIETSAGTVLIDGSGSAVSKLDKSTAQWSVEDALILRGWTNRVIYTRLAATSTVKNPPLLRVNLGASGSNTTDAGYSAISSLLNGADAGAKLKIWRYFVGADIGGTTTPLPTRTGTIMGDIINSSPAVLEYKNFPASITSSISSTLYAAWQAHNPNSGTSDKTGRFRMIFVGSNQGFLHAFGEVCWTNNATVAVSVGPPVVTATVPVTTGVVDELWAFTPTDILHYIDQLGVSANLHRFSVDGPPAVYLLDRPQSATQTSGNGKFDVSAAYPERAIVIFGLGKGGRSYYAINIADPAAPVMQWSLCPDEPDNYASDRNKSGTGATPIANMGLSTCIPTIARVVTGRENTSKANLIVDAVLLGGGYSDTNIEAALPGTPAGPALNTRLGRSAIAIEVNSGDILGIWDISSTAGAGSVPAGVVPHEYAEGSGLHQRAYFTDYFGGLWALGSNARQGATGGYMDFRMDSAKIDTWIARNVYRQTVSITTAGDGLISTLPVPFNIPYFPVVRAVDPKVAPGAVGIAFVTGDRNNPLDDMTYTNWTEPNQHRVNILFDRQDTNTTLINTDLASAADSSFSLDTSSSSYFLKTGYGYYINFTNRSGGKYVAKGIIPPLALDGALFYSSFNPTSSSCAGGTGITDTFRVCNVMRPVVNSTTNWGASNANASSVTAVNGCKSGRVLSWTGVASTLSLRSILTGVQAGMTSSSGVNNDPTQLQNLVLQDLPTQGNSRFVKVRVWRTVH